VRATSTQRCWRALAYAAFDQSEGVQAIAAASHGFASGLNGGDEFIPLPSPGIVGRGKIEDFFFGTAVVWLTLPPHQPLGTVMTVPSGQVQIAIPAKDLQLK
jgi:hypothetical protein